MANRTSEQRTSARVQSRRAVQLREASEQLATVLKAVDLEAEQELADAVIDALQATDRAYQFETVDRAEDGAEGERTDMADSARSEWFQK